MDSITGSERAEVFHRMHAGEGPLVLVNAWDAASARLFEDAGAPAIATSSAGVAWSLGYADGEHMSVGELVDACARIVRVVSVPVSADIVRGFGRTPKEACAIVRALVGVGVVGVNIEDGVVRETNELVPAMVSCANISALRSLAADMGVRLFINARTDGYFLSDADPVARYEETVRRAHLYAEAGADGIFIPGLDDIDEIARMVRDVPRPLNVYAGYEGVPSVAALKRVGVRRVSLGCGPMQALLALARRIAHETLADGTYSAMTADMLSNGEVNGLFAAPR